MRFRKGDLVILFGENRSWMAELGEKEIQTHIGAVKPSQIIGKEEGTRVTTSTGTELVCFRPTFPDFIHRTKRKAQIIYPKDLGAITLYGDLARGESILEAGAGSGIATIHLLRCVGPEGMLISIERRKDFMEVALRNVERFFGQVPDNLFMLLGDARDVKFRKRFDRILLDLPDPWEAVENLSVFLRRGGFLINYSPNIGQVQRVVEAMKGFTDIRTFEILERDWIVDEKRARPSERMFGHTGFITMGRKL